MSTTEIERTTVIDVEGMTCGHCVHAVTTELSGLEGVRSVSVDLNAGGVSPVTVVSGSTIDDDALRAAVDEAGYAVAAVRRDA